MSELCLLNSPQVDLSARAVRMPKVKTDASERVVPMLPTLHDVLLTHRAEQPTTGEAAFRTRNGTRQSPDNVRSRVLARVQSRANDLLLQRGEEPIEHLTPHTYVGPSPRCSQKWGFRQGAPCTSSDTRIQPFTMRVYQQVLDMGGAAPEQLERLIGCSVDEALDPLSGREVWRPEGTTGGKGPSPSWRRLNGMMPVKHQRIRLGGLSSAHAPVAQRDRAAAF